MSDFERSLQLLIVERVDDELGPRRPAPPFERRTEPVYPVSFGLRWSATRPVLLALVAAACVVAVLVGAIGLSHLTSSSPTPPATESPTPVGPSPVPSTSATPAPPAGLTSATPAAIRPLQVYSVRIPSVGLPNYTTSGDYPQVNGSGISLAAVNAALRDVILTDQAAYRHEDRKIYGTTLDHYQGKGIYRIDFNPTKFALPAAMSASTTVVSTMFPTEELYPGGNDGQGWLWLTVAVPSGHPLQLVDLLRSESRGLEAVAGYVLPHQAKQTCIAQGGAQFLDSAFAPKAANYRAFALTKGGLIIGTSQGQGAAEACGTYRVTVPWSVVRPQLNALGLRLVDGLR